MSAAGSATASLAPGSRASHSRSTGPVATIPAGATAVSIPCSECARADLGPAGLYNAIGRSNILSPGTRLEVSPGARFDAFISYRAMWLAAGTDSFSTTGVRDATGNSGDFAGHQIDSRVRYWLVPRRLRFEADGVLLAKGRFLRDAPNAGPGKWTRYVSLNMTGFF